jgi:mycothione reductase
LKEYDVIAIGSGSSMNILSAMLRDPDLKAAVIEKDDPGGICLTRGCIPTKMLVYPAELVRIVGDLKRFGIDAPLKKVDFGKVMQRMRDHIRPDIEGIRKGLSQAENIDYYPSAAEFTGPYTLKVGEEIITSRLILLCLGSEVSVPPVKGLDSVGYHTSDTVLDMTELPDSIAIIGGGYIAAEYGHFFSAMGSKVTIIGRNPQFLPREEPEVSELALKEMGTHMTVYTNHEVLEVRKTMTGKKKTVARDRTGGKTTAVTADEILVATGRSPNTEPLHPERSGVEVDGRGWIKVNEFLETTKPGIWAFGDATGKHMFKHVANYESLIVYQNAVLGKRESTEYHAVPYAVFTHPEIAAVGRGEGEAIAAYGEENVRIGFQRYEDTVKGQAMGVKDFFVKVIVEKERGRILGAHIIGPQASVLIQEIINLMYTPSGSWTPARAAMHIHPALSEVVERAFQGLMSPDQYSHMRSHHH